MRFCSLIDFCTKSWMKFLPSSRQSFETGYWKKWTSNEQNSPGLKPSSTLKCQCPKIWTIYSPEKNPEKGVEDILFWQNPWSFLDFHFTLGNSRENKASSPGKFCKQYVLHIPWKLQGLKPPWAIIHGNSSYMWHVLHDFFLISPLEIPLLFLI